MNKKIILLLMLWSVTVGVLSGCNVEPITPTLPVLETDSMSQSTSEIQTVAEGYDVLGGVWVVGAFYYKNDYQIHLIDLSEVESIEDFYDGVYLIFNEDGTFMHTNLYNSCGQYTKYRDNSYILKTDTVFIYDVEKGDVVKKEDSSPSSYLITILDENTIQWGILDPQTGKMKTDSEPLFFERKDAESEYIQKYKTPLNSSTNVDGSTPSNPTIPPFTNQYGSSETKCAHSGCSNYIASSGDTNCCTVHSGNCFNCGCYIDEDAMYCISCLVG